MDYFNRYFHKIWGQSHEQFVRKCAASTQTIRGRLKFNDVWPNLNQIWGSPNHNANKFVQNAKKCMANQRTGYDGNSIKCDQELIRSVDPLMNISIKFVLKHTESTWSIKDHEMTEIQWSVTKSPWGLRNLLIRIFTKFGVNTMISMSRNVKKLNAWKTARQFTAFLWCGW